MLRAEADQIRLFLNDFISEVICITGRYNLDLSIGVPEKSDLVVHTLVWVTWVDLNVEVVSFILINALALVSEYV